jgi:cytosine/adenosine deaminase-related metal-dependent hydrolase
MAMGRPVFARAKIAGAKASLGIDIVSNFSGDMFAQMRLLLQSERGFDNEARADAPRALGLRAREVLALATIEGARAAGLDAVAGSISPGKQADLVLVRTDSPHMAGVCDPIAALVLYAAASDVDTVLIGGDVMKRGGVLVGHGGGDDWPRLRERVRASGERIRRRASTLPRDEIAGLLAAAMFVPGR